MAAATAQQEQRAMAGKDEQHPATLLLRETVLAQMWFGRQLEQHCDRGNLIPSVHQTKSLSAHPTPSRFAPTRTPAY